MSAPTWRNFFTYNRYTSIAARATRRALKEEERVAAERRGFTALRVQEWKEGKGGEQVVLGAETKTNPGPPPV